MSDRGFRIRIWLVAAGLCFGFLALAGRLALLQLGRHEQLERKYESSSVGLRGAIYDRNGDQFPMALSLPAWKVFLDPYSVKTNHSVRAIAGMLAKALDLDAGEVEGKLAKKAGRHYIPIAVTQNDDVYNLIHTNKLVSGVGTDDIMIRRYPQGRRMSHVLGFVNALGVGGAGIEQRYNEYLRGTPGLIQSEKDVRKREVWVKRRTDIAAIPGNNVYLTLDHNIQAVVEDTLRETVEKFDAIRGWAIVQRVKTGELLALATCPDFDPGHYDAVPEELWQNYVLGTVYEPGSIMKAVTVSAFLNERLGTPRTPFDAGSGSWNYGGKILHDHATGVIDVATALKKSSNIVSAKIALRLGNERFYRYLRAFNFGSKFGIELPGEERGLLAVPAKWNKLTPTRVAIGQGIAVTALQMVSAYNAIANDGVMMKPYLVARVVSHGGEVIREAKPERIGHPIRTEVARQVREMLRGVTDAGGTGTRARVKGYSVGGKTGTAQKVERGHYTQDYFASFIGFLPVSKPEIIVLVTVDRPRPQHTGSYVSAPAFSKIAAASARYLEIAPDLPLDEEEEEKDDEPPPTGILTDPDILDE